MRLDRLPVAPGLAEDARVRASAKLRSWPSSRCSQRTWRCAWLGVAPLLSCRSLSALALFFSGREAKAGAPIELGSIRRALAAWIAVSISGLSDTAPGRGSFRSSGLARSGVCVGKEHGGLRGSRGPALGGVGPGLRNGSRAAPMFVVVPMHEARGPDAGGVESGEGKVREFGSIILGSEQGLGVWIVVADARARVGRFGVQLM